MFWQELNSRSQSQLWGLAAGGILTKLNSETFNELAFQGGPLVSQAILRDWWNVYDFLALKRTLNWLWNEGHGCQCIELCDYLLSPDDPRFEGVEIPPELNVFMQSNMAKLRSSQIIAWDLCRLINVARWGYTAKMIGKEEAWVWILRAAQKLQNSFSSWEEVGQDFMLGFHFWRHSTGAGDDIDVVRSYEWLMSSSESPWVRLAWDTPLSDGRSIETDTDAAGVTEPTTVTPKSRVSSLPTRMDPDRKRLLKKLGKAEVMRQSAELEKRMAASNPADIGTDAWVAGYRTGIKRERWLRKRLPILHRKRLDKFFIVAPCTSQGWVPTLEGYLRCLNCGSVLPSLVPRGRIKWGKCKCGNIRWRLFLFWGGIDVRDESKVEPIKLTGKA